MEKLENVFCTHFLYKGSTSYFPEVLMFSQGAKECLTWSYSHPLSPYTHERKYSKILRMADRPERTKGYVFNYGGFLVSDPKNWQVEVLLTCESCIYSSESPQLKSLVYPHD